MLELTSLKPEDDLKEARRKEAEAIYGGEDDDGDDLMGEDDGENEKTWDELFAESDTFTITQITQGLRDPNRANIFLDGVFAFSLDISQVIDLNVKVKQKVDAERLKILQDASEYGKLYQRTLEWVLTRPHSVQETRNYLKRRQFKRMIINKKREREMKKPFPEIRDDTIQVVMTRLVERGYIDDLKFAKYFVENRNVKRGTSMKKLKMELMKKGIKDEIAKMALEEVDRPEDEEIIKVIRKKRAKYDDFKLVGYLTRQGFDFNKAKEAVENYKPEDDPLL